MTHSAFVTTREELQQLIQKAVKQAVSEQIPEVVREATAKEWLTKEELQQLTGWKPRTIQHLRDTRQIPFSQHGHKILYPRKGIIDFLEDNHIKPRG